MSFERCKRCGNFSFEQDCKCKEFAIIDEDGEEHSIWSLGDGESAALAYAEKSNTDGDYYLINNEVIISVDGVNYLIGAEPDIMYSADIVKDHIK